MNRGTCEGWEAASVISDIVGMSGRRILKAIIAGETNVIRLSELGSARLKCSRSDLAAALDGRVTAHHRFLIDHHLGLIEELERRIAAFDTRIDEVLAPFRDAVERLITTPGVGRVAAEVILAEIGPDMSPFPTAGHLSAGPSKVLARCSAAPWPYRHGRTNGNSRSLLCPPRP